MGMLIRSTTTKWWYRQQLWRQASSAVDIKSAKMSYSYREFFLDGCNFFLCHAARTPIIGLMGEYLFPIDLDGRRSP